MPKIVRCKYCDAKIVWANTKRGKSVPLDAKPDADGHIYFTEGDAIYLSPDERDDCKSRNIPLFISHLDHCRKPEREEATREVRCLEPEPEIDPDPDGSIEALRRARCLARALLDTLDEIPPNP